MIEYCVINYRSHVIIRSLDLIYLLAESLYPFTTFLFLPTLALGWQPTCLLCFSDFLKISHIRDIMQYLPFSVWHFSLTLKILAIFMSMWWYLIVVEFAFLRWLMVLGTYSCAHGPPIHLQWVVLDISFSHFLKGSFVLLAIGFWDIF